MVVSYIGIGSNLGDRKKNIDSAIKLLGGMCSVLKVSSLHETEPVGYKDQEMFLNGVVCVETGLAPLELLSFLQSVELKLKRVKTVRDGPRTIDLDILFYGALVLNSEELVIPHPKLHERMFVLEPLREIAPDLLHPVLGRSVLEMVDGRVV